MQARSKTAVQCLQVSWRKYECVREDAIISTIQRCRLFYSRWCINVIVTKDKRLLWAHALSQWAYCSLSDRIQLSFQITIQQLAQGRFSHTKIRVGFCLVIPDPSLPERDFHTHTHTRAREQSSGPSAFRLQGGLPSLDTARSRKDTYTRLSACNHPPRSPSFPRMTFRLSCPAYFEL